jgi:acetyl-CoA C-acetyltransferase
MMNERMIYILGGSQTDFARNWAREGLGLFDMFKENVLTSLSKTNIPAADIQVAHVGNFVSALFTGQAHLNGFFGHVHPDLAYVPSSSHEAACASGSVAVLAAMRDIEAGHYDLACVLGIEMMKNVDGVTAAEYLGAAGWKGTETIDCTYPWPNMFSQLFAEYAKRYGMDDESLNKIAKNNFDNAQRNPNAQTRHWQFTEKSFTRDDQANPVIEGHIRKQDCGQVTDGAASIFLASEAYATKYAAKQGIELASIPRIKGWGHKSAPMLQSQKLVLSKNEALIFPHVKATFDDALHRAGMHSIRELDGLEVHDCFSMTQYMLIDHCGLTPPGESYQAINDGTISLSGDLPINPSGGLIGLGHPVGATGVRMLLDAYKQVTATAGDYQIKDAKNFGVFNLGGSTTTCVSFVVGLDNH